MNDIFDSCVALKWIFHENGSDKARTFREQYQNSIINLLAPDAFPIEVAERANRITPAEGERSLKTMLVLLPVLQDSLSLLPRAYELSSQHRIGVYDCLYVALAEREGCELVTADDRLVTSLGTQFPISSLDSF
jgi:predicted nucleic acid-binding protein